MKVINKIQHIKPIVIFKISLIKMKSEIKDINHIITIYDTITSTNQFYVLSYKILTVLMWYIRLYVIRLTVIFPQQLMSLSVFKNVSSSGSLSVLTPGGYRLPQESPTAHSENYPITIQGLLL